MRLVIMQPLVSNSVLDPNGTPETRFTSTIQSLALAGNRIEESKQHRLKLV